LKPAFRLLIEGKDQTEEIGKRLTRLSVKDEAGVKSDNLELVLSNRPHFKWPTRGQRLDVSLGYEDRLVNMGAFAVRSISARGAPHEVKIDAFPIHSIQTLKSQREQSWEVISLPDLVDTIAKRHGLKSAVSRSFSGIMLEHEDQSESDLAFLSRIGRRYHAIVKTQGGFLIFSESGLGESSSGKVIEPLRLTKFIDYEYTGADMSYTGVKASYWNRRAASKGQVLVGKDDRVFDIRFHYKSETTARKAAESKFKRLKNSDEKLSVTIPGNPEAFAERKFAVVSLGEGIDDLWLSKSVEHILEPNAFASRIEFEGRDYVNVN
jgi:phage protein D